MPESRSRTSQLVPQTWQNPVIPSLLDHIVIPKRRSSLRNARSGNHLISLRGIDASRKHEVSQSRTPSLRSSLSSEDLEVLVKEVETLGISERKLIPMATSRAQKNLLTPPCDVPSGDTHNKQDQQPFLGDHHGSYFTTPVKKRAINYGRVVDTPPSSTDRFIPSRTREDTAVNNFKANKPFFELTAAQKQMRMDGITPDPFRARRVTPLPLVRRVVSSGSRCPSRVVSASNVWSIGGSIPHPNHIVAIDTGRGVRLGSGTNAQLFSADFFDYQTEKEYHERYEDRLAMALELDRSAKVLDFTFGPNKYKVSKLTEKTTEWRDSTWASNQLHKVLDAPSLRDDFYCALLAHCTVSNLLAVGLKNQVYLWSESKGVQTQVRFDGGNSNCYVTSLSFSSPGGGKGILAIGRSDGRVCFWHPQDDRDRLHYHLPKPIACLAFKPVPTKRFPELIDAVTPAEELLVGDEAGNIYYFSLKWPRVERPGKSTTMTLLAKLSLHKQQVCGLAWSPDGEYFASGGNDNLCFAIAIKEILEMPSPNHTSSRASSQGLSPHAPTFVPNRDAHHTLSSGGGRNGSESALVNPMALERSQLPSRPWPLIIGRDRACHCWPHAAAVKAIAFCPWQKGLLATGGGSNDRAIHFFHVKSGACLATIEVHAQVTSLIWSKTKREICATFGYSQPDHPYRIAVFSWPECEQVVRIPWHGNMRALHAVPYPGGPNDESDAQLGTDKRRKAKTKDSEGGTWWSRTKEEGCIVVVASDESIKFHEVWSGKSCGMGPKRGGLAWSSILEDEEGGSIDLDGSEIIR